MDHRGSGVRRIVRQGDEARFAEGGVTRIRNFSYAGQRLPRNVVEGARNGRADLSLRERARFPTWWRQRIGLVLTLADPADTRYFIADHAARGRALQLDVALVLGRAERERKTRQALPSDAAVQRFPGLPGAGGECERARADRGYQRALVRCFRAREQSPLVVGDDQGAAMAVRQNHRKRAIFGCGAGFEPYRRLSVFPILVFVLGVCTNQIEVVDIEGLAAIVRDERRECASLRTTPDGVRNAPIQGKREPERALCQRGCGRSKELELGTKRRGIARAALGAWLVARCFSTHEHAARAAARTGRAA